MIKEFDLEDFVMNLDRDEEKQNAHHSLFQIPDWDNDESINLKEGE